MVSNEHRPWPCVDSSGLPKSGILTKMWSLNHHIPKNKALFPHNYLALPGMLCILAKVFKGL